MSDVVIDLETLGRTPGCVILSLGAVAINDQRKIYSDFYKSITVASQDRLSVESNTLLWWIRQPKEVQEEAFGIASPALPITDSLLSFSRWLQGLENVENLRIWGYGATFDLAILGAAYASTKIPRPWHYRQERCLRTLRKVVADTHGVDVKDEVEQPEMPHHALEDARCQGRMLVALYDILERA